MAPKSGFQWELDPGMPVRRRSSHSAKMQKHKCFSTPGGIIAMRAMPWARLRSDSSAFGCNCDVPVAGQAIQYAASKGAAATQKQTELYILPAQQLAPTLGF